MEEFIVQGSLAMGRGSLLRVEDGRGLLVYVWEGELWLTEDGERRDRILQAGQWHRLERRGAALGYAFKRSVVTLTAPVPEGYARRILFTRAGGQPEELYNATRARLRRLWNSWFAPQGRVGTAAL